MGLRFTWAEGGSFSAAVRPVRITVYFHYRTVSDCAEGPNNTEYERRCPGAETGVLIAAPAEACRFPSVESDPVISTEGPAGPTVQAWGGVLTPHSSFQNPHSKTSGPGGT